ncbi:hypothetical protein CTAYLR_003044 [Chrysophaeum taylorii]|uniref:FAD dependent oxidoreductase domain-containing protein n=1 Tax=Chrysophaeum taylorii TaxID=2483200 RepID=A0AAD7XJN3_9STRA|nr:hypothetical protein CTAYLR_003044 [Chrysophaeum taylorii]
MQRASQEIVVVGGGVMGAWAAARCAAKGTSVALVEQFNRGNSQGSSHGDGRIWRKAYDEDLYVDMMELSLELWGKLDGVMAETGMLAFADSRSRDVLDRLCDLFRRRNVSHDLLDATAARARFPQFGGVPECDAVFLEAAGVIYATRAVEATWRLAEELGVKTFEGQRIRAVDGTTLTTPDYTFEASKAAIFAPGAWLSPLSKRLFNFEIPTRVTAECVSYHRPADASYSVANGMPVFTMRIDNGLGPFGYYGIPAIDIPGVKVSAHHCGPVLDSNQLSGAANLPDRDENVLDANSRLVRTFWGPDRLDPTPFYTQRCLYTATPDHDYVLGRLPSNPKIILAGGGSGHAFKMGPAIGEALACLALNEPTPFDISQFKPDRPALVNARGHFPVPQPAYCK